MDSGSRTKWTISELAGGGVVRAPDGLFICLGSWQQGLKGHGFSRAVTCAWRVGLQPLREFALRLKTEVPQWLKPP